MMIILIGDINNNPLNTLCEKPDWIMLFAPNTASPPGLSHGRHMALYPSKKKPWQRGGIPWDIPEYPSSVYPSVLMAGNSPRFMEL